MSKKKPNTLIIEDDCIRAMAEIPDKKIDFILCDLPYGTTQNNWDSVVNLKDLWKEYRRILSPKGVIALTSHGAFTAQLILSGEGLFKYKIIWVKSKATNFLNAKKQPLRKHEDICIFYAKQPNYSPQMFRGEAYDKGQRKEQLTGSYGNFDPSHIKSNGTRYPTDVVYFKTAESEGKVWHSTQKPVGLGRYLIRTYTKTNDIILDNCFGSGSFLLAAALEGRDSIGIEINKSVKRFKKKQLNLIDVARTRLGDVSNISLVKSGDTCQTKVKINSLLQKHFRKSQASNSRHQKPKQRHTHLNPLTPAHP